MKPAIIEPAISQWVAEGRELTAAVRDAENSAIDLEKKLTTTREAARARRIELGRFLADKKDRMKWGEWGEFLDALEISRTSAHRYIEEASQLFQKPQVEQSGGQVAETPSGHAAVNAPPPRDEDAPREADAGATNTEDEAEVDRDTWCTPPWLAELIGSWDLDPCTNERSIIAATLTFDLERRGEDGLVQAAGVPKKYRVFINPPYSDVGPWIEAYGHTRFCFLLKLDTSTAWFEQLIAKTELILIPRRKRVAFIAPPGVPTEKTKAQQFPHALFYARAEDATKEIIDRCYRWRVEI